MNGNTASAVAAYIGAITTANLLVAQYGPSITIINAFALIGLDLALRDYLHDTWRSHRLTKMGGMIAAAGAISYLLNPATERIAIASAVAFMLAALADWTVYHAARRWRWIARSNVSNVAGAAVDSIAFPTLAFGVLMPAIIVGQFAAKVGGGFVWSIILNPWRGRAAAHHN